MSKILALSLLIALTSPQASRPKPPASIVMGNVELRLGMSREQVLRLLADNYNVQGGLVITKAGPPYVPIGSINFSDAGILQGVSRVWTPDDQVQGVDTAEALFGAISQVTKPHALKSSPGQARNCLDCSIIVYSSSNPQTDTKQIIVSDGVKTVTLTVMRSRTSATMGINQWIDISEEIGK